MKVPQRRQESNEQAVEMSLHRAKEEAEVGNVQSKPVSQG